MAGLLQRIFGGRQTTPGSPSSGSGSYWVGTPAAGVYVDEETALRLSSVYAAVRLISSTIATLPFSVVRKRADGGSDPQPDHPVAALMTSTPDPTTPEVDSVTFREAMVAQLLLWGNAYAEIARTPSGEVAGLYMMPAWTVDPKRDDRNRLVYEVRGDGGLTRVFTADRVLHFRGLAYNGQKGMSVVAAARESLSLGLAAERFGASFFGNSARPSGVLTHPSNISENAKTNLRDSWGTTHSGPGGWQKVALLEEGMKFEPLTVPPDDAQFIETRKASVTDIARWFGVPPHKIGDLERATFSNIEQQQIQFVVDCLRPWCSKIECEIRAKLLRRDPMLQAKHNLNGLLRGDTTTRGAFYTAMWDRGVLSTNDIRAYEDLNPVEGGDERFRPMNMERLTASESAEPPMNGTEAAKIAQHRVVAASIAAQSARECAAVELNAKRYNKPDAFGQAIAKFYRSHIEQTVADVSIGLVALADSIARALTGEGLDLEAEQRIAGSVRAWAVARCEVREDEAIGAFAEGGVADLVASWRSETPDADAHELIEHAAMTAALEAA